MLYLPLTFMSPFCPYHLAQLISIGDSRISSLAFESLKRVFEDRLIQSIRINSWCFEQQSEANSIGESNRGLLQHQPLLCIEPPVTVTPSDDWAHSSLFSSPSYLKAITALRKVQHAILTSTETDFDSLFQEVLEFYNSPPTLLLGDRRGCIRSLSISREATGKLSYQWTRVVYQHCEPMPVKVIQYAYSPALEKNPVLIQLGSSTILIARILDDDDTSTAQQTSIETSRQPPLQANDTVNKVPSSTVKSSLAGLLGFGSKEPVAHKESRPGTSKSSVSLGRKIKISSEGNMANGVPFKLLIPEIKFQGSEIDLISSFRTKDLDKAICAALSLPSSDAEIIGILTSDRWITFIAIQENGISVTERKVMIPGSSKTVALRFIGNSIVAQTNENRLQIFHWSEILNSANPSSNFAIDFTGVCEVSYLLRRDDEFCVIGLYREPKQNLGGQNASDFRVKKEAWVPASLISFAFDKDLREKQAFSEPTVWLCSHLHLLENGCQNHASAEMAKLIADNLSFTNLIFCCLGFYPLSSDPSHLRMPNLYSTLYTSGSMSTPSVNDPFVDLTGDDPKLFQFQSIDQSILRLLSLFCQSGIPSHRLNMNKTAKNFTFVSHFFHGLWKSSCQFSAVESVIRDYVLSVCQNEEALRILRESIELEIRNLGKKSDRVRRLEARSNRRFDSGSTETINLNGFQEFIVAFIGACDSLSQHSSGNLRIIFLLMADYLQVCLEEQSKYLRKEIHPILSTLNKLREAQASICLDGYVLLGWIEMNLVCLITTEAEEIADYLKRMFNEFQPVLLPVANSAADLCLEYQRDDLFLEICTKAGLFVGGFQRYMLHSYDSESSLSGLTKFRLLLFCCNFFLFVELMEAFCAKAPIPFRLRHLCHKSSDSEIDASIGISQYQTVTSVAASALPHLFQARPLELGNLVSRYPLFAAVLFVSSTFLEDSWRIVEGSIQESSSFIEGWLAIHLSALKGFLFLEISQRLHSQNNTRLNAQIDTDLFTENDKRVRSDSKCYSAHLTALIFERLQLTSEQCVKISVDFESKIIIKEGRIVLDTGGVSKPEMTAEVLSKFLQSLHGLILEYETFESVTDAARNFLNLEPAKVGEKHVRLKSLWKCFRMAINNIEASPPPPVAKYVDPVLLSGIGNAARNNATWLFGRYWTLLPNNIESDRFGHRTAAVSLFRSIRGALLEFLLSLGPQCLKKHRVPKFQIIDKPTWLDILQKMLRRNSVDFGTSSILCLVLLSQLPSAFDYSLCAENNTSFFVASQLNCGDKCLGEISRSRREMWMALMRFWLRSDYLKSEESETAIAVMLYNSMCRREDALDYLSDQINGAGTLLSGRIKIHPTVLKLLQPNEFPLSKSLLNGCFDVLHRLAQDCGGCGAALRLADCGIVVEDLMGRRDLPDELIDRMQSSLWKALNHLHQETIQEAELAHANYSKAMDEDLEARFHEIDDQSESRMMSFSHTLCDLCESKIAEPPKWIVSDLLKQNEPPPQWNAVFQNEINILRSKAFVLDCGHVIHGMCCRLATLQQSALRTRNKYQTHLTELYTLTKASQQIREPGFLTEWKRQISSSLPESNKTTAPNVTNDKLAVRYQEVYE
eukprot:Gregarina_sp_Poly_1__10112@NODE_689_length_6761_cov_96_646549_g519_i0_p1_GENE_NODE_689_length_6761_cov_96_646549_g519_i0NODE_689_length_6761_cov_96_646549_g519_i0_p1_ORF_typecomplete_len1599_score225_91zfRING_5/PF14634_6/3_6e02zfRING_5/PF14634_6/2_4zfRING_UBOX/PF13445_6/3_6e03zfRING_UBOX/PF13445_6/8_3e03zfRING_UBOX/PF13445_6/1_2_NODE_689_length_6761_cov_96_646549_g519_i02565052